MTPFEQGELLRVLPCGHSFRVKCIDEWLIRKVPTQGGSTRCCCLRFTLFAPVESTR